MQSSKTNLLDHLRWFRQAALEEGADFLVSGQTFQVLLRHDERTWVFEPRVVDAAGRVRAPVPGPEEPLQGFAGWLPYRVRTWPLASDRVRFHAFCREHGLPVLPLAFQDDPSLTAVLVRSQQSDGDEAARGPYRSTAERPLDPARGEYYEQFLAGTRVRFWFWNDALLCGELHDMPMVRGNGGSSLRDLILERAGFGLPLSDTEQGALLARVSPLLHLQGHALSTVLPPAIPAIVDHVIDSPLAHPSERRPFLAQGDAAPAWLAVARAAAKEILSSAPAEVRAGTLFTLDGILDAGKLWLVEVDANPVVQPVVYLAMVTASLKPAPVAPGPHQGEP